MTQQSKINKKSFEELYDKADKTKLLKDRLDIIYAIISIVGSIFSTIYSGKIIYAMGITLFLIKLLSWTKKREAKSIHKDGWRMHEKIICKKSNLLQYLLISASDTRKMYKYMGEKQKKYFSYLIFVILLFIATLPIADLDKNITLKIAPALISLSLLYDLYEEYNSYLNAERTLADMQIIIEHELNILSVSNSKITDLSTYLHIYSIYCSCMDLHLPLEPEVYLKVRDGIV